jgi:hypothetical protein
VRILLAVVALAACSPSPSKQLDLDRIRVSLDAKMRTDTVGQGKFAAPATFVLVDADNTATEGAYVTLGGTLTDASGATVSTLAPQSLWVPAGETRTYALIDAERRERPAAKAAVITVKGAMVPTSPPPAHVEDVHEFTDNGHVVVQGMLVNDAPKRGQLIVIGAFHDAGKHPLTRPFDVVPVEPHERKTVQFVGGPGSVTGAIFVGDVQY